MVTEAKRSQVENTVDSLWAALAAEEDSQGLLVEAGAGRRGVGGGEGEGRGGEGGRGRGVGAGSWTAGTMGEFVGNPA